MDARFVTFGASHAAALAVVAAVAALTCVAARRGGERVARGLRIALGVVLAALTVAHLVSESLDPARGWRSYLPLQLCDLAVAAGVVALLTANVTAFELLYFWGLAGTLLATLTPDVTRDFPHPEFLFYFAFHGTVVVAAIYLAVGCRLRPRPGAPWRMLAITNAYAAVMAVVNVATGSNFLYLCRKPASATLLDYFGPWPVYLVVAEIFAIAAFWLLYLPLCQRRAVS